MPYSTICVCVCLYVRTVGHCKLRQLIKIEVAAASGATQGKAAEARNDGDDGKNAAQLIYYAERARGALWIGGVVVVVPFVVAANAALRQMRLLQHAA